MNSNKEALAMLWANQIRNKRRDFRDVPVKLRDDVYYVLVQTGFHLEYVEQE